jgi:hypothetical protein
MYKIMNMTNKHHINLSIDSKTYHEAKRLFPPKQISQLFSEFLKEYSGKKKQQELKEAYQRTAKSKKMQEESKV